MTQESGPYAGTTSTADPLEVRESDNASTGAADQAKHVAGEAKDQAADVGATAKEAGGHVAGVAQEQAKNVASKAADHAKNVTGQARQEAQQQAQAQQQRAAAGLHSIGDQLRSMAGDAQQSGLVTDLTHEAADRVQEVAGWLDQRDPNQLLGEVKSFARRRPGTFLLVAAGAGLVAGRLTRGLIADKNDDDASPEQPAATPVVPVVPVVPVDPAVPIVPATTPDRSGYDFFDGGRG